MTRGPRRLERGRGSSGPVLLAALAGFAIICGLVILVLGTGSVDKSGSKQRQQTQEQLNKVINKQMGKATQAINQAEGALNSTNYGAIRGHLQRARESIAVVRFKIKETRQRPPDNKKKK